jgi:hypothetical protein
MMIDTDKRCPENRSAHDPAFGFDMSGLAGLGVRPACAPLTSRLGRSGHSAAADDPRMAFASFG